MALTLTRDEDLELLQNSEVQVERTVRESFGEILADGVHANWDKGVRGTGVYNHRGDRGMYLRVPLTINERARSTLNIACPWWLGDTVARPVFDGIAKVTGVELLAPVGDQEWRWTARVSKMHQVAA